MTDVNEYKQNNNESDLSGKIAFLYTQPILFLVNRVQQTFAYLFAEECRKCNVEVSQPQLEVLYIISIKPGLDQITLAKSLGTDRSTITVLLDNLAKRNLVTRERTKDRRRNSLYLTDGADKILKAGWLALTRSCKKLLSCMNDNDAKEFLDVFIEVTSQKNSPAPIWDPSILKAPGAENRAVQRKLKKLYQIPAFLLDRYIQIEYANLHESISPYGLSSGQAGTLFIISLFGPIDQGALRHAQGTDRSSISVIVPKLVSLELISREKDTMDKRRSLVRCTKKGRELIKEASGSVAEAAAKCFEDFPEETRKRLQHVVIKLIDALDTES